MSSAFPKQIGKYEVQGILGRGGMGAVYRVRQKSLGRDAAHILGAGIIGKALAQIYGAQVPGQA